jgi:hypothetical protein
LALFLVIASSDVANLHQVELLVNAPEFKCVNLAERDTPVANRAFVGQTLANEQTVLYHDRD